MATPVGGGILDEKKATFKVFIRKRYYFVLFIILEGVKTLILLDQWKESSSGYFK